MSVCLSDRQEKGLVLYLTSRGSLSSVSPPDPLGLVTSFWLFLSQQPLSGLFRLLLKDKSKRDNWLDLQFFVTVLV